ncbi:hypothetical protein ACFFIS_05670 [Virgibacillus soli]
MALFINRAHHPDVYKTDEEIVASNQHVFQTDVKAEMIQSQRKVNERLQESVRLLNRLYEQQHIQQQAQWQKVDRRLKEINIVNQAQARKEEEMLHKISMLMEFDKTLQSTIEKYHEEDKELGTNITQLLQMKPWMEQQLSEQLERDEKVLSQLSQLISAQEMAEQQMMHDKEEQKSIVSRLDKQAATLEKVTRQLDHFRSILYERSHYLAGKVEDSVRLTASYLYNMSKGKDKNAISMYIDNNEESKTTK